MKTYENYEALDKRISEGGQPIVIEFHAAWCSKCKMLGPIFEKVGAAMEDNAEFVAIDVDAMSEAADKFGIMNLPSIVIIKDRAIVHQASGLFNETTLTNLIESHIG